MKNYQKYIFAAVSLISLILILSFKSIPSGQLWKNYNILYVPVQADDQTVINAIENAGIEEAVVLARQYLPVKFGANSPEIAMYRLNNQQEEFSYGTKRNLYFFDKDNEFRLYYIPVMYKSKLSHVITSLNQAGISAGIDSSGSYPWFLPLLCLVAAVLLTVIVEKKLFFASVVAIPVVFTFCNPFYPIILANLLIQLTVFFASNVMNRKGYQKVLINNFIIPLMVLLSFVCAFSCAVKSGLFYIIAIAGAVSAALLYREIEAFIQSRQIFVPVYIRSAKRVSIFAGKSKSVMGGLTGTAVLVILLFVFTSSDTVNAHFSKLQLPAAKGFVSDLPDLNDYCNWMWNVQTYPYKSLNKTADKDSIEFPRYVYKNGIVEESVQTLSFNNDYKNQVIDDIDELPFDSIESVMKSQKELNPGYAATSSYHMGLFGLIMSLLCLFVLLFIDISIIIRTGARK